MSFEPAPALALEGRALVVHLGAPHAVLSSALVNGGARRAREVAWLEVRDDELRPPVDAERLVDCIECGLCVSVCPAAATSETYVGPAALAGAHQQFQATGEISLLDWADHQDGLWRCHSAYECTAVGPSNVNPAWRIMNLRRHVVTQRIRSLFGAKEPRP